MLRRGKCYWQLERYDEAIDEYKKWLELVEEARRLPAGTIFITPCLFDGPSDVSDEAFAQVKLELAEISKAKAQAKANAKAAKEEFRQQRQRWYQETGAGSAQSRHERTYNNQNESSYGRSWNSFESRSGRWHFANPHSCPYKKQRSYTWRADSSSRASSETGAGGAQSRRERTYNYQNESSQGRRWDSFEGRSGRWHSANPHDSFPYENHRSYMWRADSSSRASGNEESNAPNGGREEGASGAKGSPGSDESINHYTVLEVSSTATDAEIKKAYHKV
jgi:hypothetical protein